MMRFGLARRAARQIEKASPSYGIVWRGVGPAVRPAPGSCVGGVAARRAHPPLLVCAATQPCERCVSCASWRRTHMRAVALVAAGADAHRRMPTILCAEDALRGRRRVLQHVRREPPRAADEERPHAVELQLLVSQDQRRSDCATQAAGQALGRSYRRVVVVGGHERQDVRAPCPKASSDQRQLATS